jgi:hypothetical protein
MKKSTKKRILGYVNLINNYSKNPPEFCKQMADEHNAKVLIDSEKIYNHYLAHGEEITLQRKALYIKNNSMTWEQFIG